MVNIDNVDDTTDSWDCDLGISTNVIKCRFNNFQSNGAGDIHNYV